jgi:hypothetical protein
VYCAKLLNSLGLGFDIIGVIILFTIDFKSIGLDASDIYLTIAPQKKMRERIKAYCGLGFILLGFLLQIFSNIL